MTRHTRPVGHATSAPDVVIDSGSFEAVVFDMDGVVTDTTEAHRSAWKRTFDEFIARAIGPDERPFDGTDYLRFVDGKPRYDGVRSFLASREVQLPEGDPSDSADMETVYGVGNRKNELFAEHVATSGVTAFPSTLDLIEGAREHGLRVGLITSSRNARVVLAAAGVADAFDIVIDGAEAARRSLPGKPDPAVFLAAAADLGAHPTRTVVVEDAFAGVRGGSRGGFGLVIGVARADNEQQLVDGGAHVVVTDLVEVTIT